MTKNNKTLSTRATANCLMLIYFASGACSLIDEVVWVRLLKLTLGNTVYATSIVVSVFMAGLAIGALIMARFADRLKKRLQLYALLEILITISALSLPWALKIADNIYVWLYRSFHPSHPQLLTVQVVISAAIILVPSMLMGSTLPLLGRFLTALEKETGHLVGKLYALNTLGAAAGCFIAGFFLIRVIGVMGALYTAAALNLTVAFGGWLLSRLSETTDELKTEPILTESIKAPAAKTTDGKFYLLVLAFFMSGLISIGYELLWMRSIVHLLGGFTYVFSAVLTIYLLGNVIGAGIGSRLAKKLKKPAIGFALTLALLGLCGIFYLPLLLLWTAKVMGPVTKALDAIYPHLPISPFLIGPLLQSAFLFIIPAIIMGIGFPIALQAWANHVHLVGRSTGTAYGANTIGAVFGGLVTGFVLIPLLGLQFSISILGLSAIWLAAVMSLVFSANLRMARRFAPLALAALVTIVAVKIPPNLFNIMVKVSPLMPSEYTLVAVKEGLTTTVSVHREPKEGFLHLCSSGQPIAGDSSGTRCDQKMLGHLGMFLNVDAQKVLSVGFGSGETTACLATHKLESANCVEIAPEVVNVALKFFRHINLGDKLDEEINMIYMDAKNYLHLTDTTYDVIVNDSIHPRLFAENASLHTKEYFQTTKQRLNDNGIIVCWLPMYDMPISVLGSIIGTLMDVFPHVTLWYPIHYRVNYFWLVGSKQQQYYSPKHIENEMLKKSVHESLSVINIKNSVDVLGYYVGDENDLRKHITDYPVNSDYSPFVEFSTDSSSPQGQLFKQFVMNVRSDSIYDHIDWTGFTKKEREKWLLDYQQVYEATSHILALYQQAYDASSYLLMVDSSDNNLEKLKHTMDGLSELPENPALLRARAQVQKELYSTGVNMVMSGKLNDALVLAADILKIYPQSPIAWMLRATAMQEKGDMKIALAAAQHAVNLAPNNPEARFILGFILSSIGQHEKAISEYIQMLQLAKDASPLDKAKMLDALASAYAAAGKINDAINTAENALELATSAGQEEMANAIRKQIQFFKAQQSPQQKR